METPAAGFIEMGIEALKTREKAFVLAELKELEESGHAAREDAHQAVGTGRTMYELGYLVGLETARALLRGLPAAQAAGIEI